MKPDTRLAIQWSVAAASWVGCAIGGAKLWPRHPIAGGAIGVIVVAPAINAVVNAILPKATAPVTTSEQPSSNYAGASRENVPPRRDTDSNYVISEAPRSNAGEVR